MACRRLVLLLPLALLAGACSSEEDPAVRPTRSSTTTLAERSTTSSTAGDTTSTSGGASPTTAGGAPTSTTAPSGPTTPLEGDGITATFTYELLPERSEVCFRIEAQQVIRDASLLRASGGVAIELPVPRSQRTVTGCAASDSITLQEIEARPSDFLVEVRTTGGVVRAPLR